MRLVSALSFIYHGKRILMKDPMVDYENGLGNQTESNKFTSYFGTMPQICAHIWNRLHYHSILPKNGCVFHQLWALMFLKMHSTEHVLAALAGVTCKTFRKWSWKFVIAISNLKPHVVSSILHTT